MRVGSAVRAPEPGGPPMNMVRIEGAADLVRSLLAEGDPQVIPMASTTAVLEDGRLRVSAYATAPAITALEAAGATVTVLRDDAEMRAHLSRVFGRFEEPPVG